MLTAVSGMGVCVCVCVCVCACLCGRQSVCLCDSSVVVVFDERVLIYEVFRRVLHVCVHDMLENIYNQSFRHGAVITLKGKKSVPVLLRVHMYKALIKNGSDRPLKTIQTRRYLFCRMLTHHNAIRAV